MTANVTGLPTDASGTRYEKPLLRCFDDLASLKDAPAAVKAVFWQQLSDVINLRPYEWGLQYCASLRHDLAEFDRLLDGEKINTGDWIRPVRSAKLNKLLEPFFNSLQGRSYLAEARLHRGLVRGVLQAGLKYGGFVDGKGQAHILSNARSSGEVWGLASNPKAKISRVIVSEDGKELVATGITPFSPLFFVPIDRKTMLADLGEKARGGSKASVTMPVIPFLAQP